MMPSSTEHALGMIETAMPDCVQVHSTVEATILHSIRSYSDVQLHQVFPLPEQATMDHAVDIINKVNLLIDADLVDGIVLDTGSANGGGSGKVHDWNISREIVGELDLPVIVAGGLTPENVASCVEQISPYGVDVSSGVEKDGHKDESLVCEFIENARCSLC
ncbi:phosphoribosylanthranilate isomerase [Methanohalophilus levihalophilus]|uniref:phosphoribosylanthranilate isomerase n=1 Tax=Methanohalophilus levihalophilus TaxID=1431282 RepID=UPI001AE1D196|nr:phosphoribosylanthranilate isomerase [Methanohalophilus levihalophilus]MBP2031105.1 phosphoribosylanthranilate isomerase [Methanohalophilus levihalophilus]